MCGLHYSFLVISIPSRQILDLGMRCANKCFVLLNLCRMDRFMSMATLVVNLSSRQTEQMGNRREPRHSFSFRPPKPAADVVFSPAGHRGQT
jgi:hypothetical protein